MEIREFDPKVDREAAHRIWREVGWIEDEENHRKGLDHFITCGEAIVATIRGEAECLVTTAPGILRYQKEDLRTSFVTSVTTSRVARKQGYAGRMTARSIVRDAESGALVSALGMFEQGFYDRLGFGTGGNEHIFSFNPSAIKLKGAAGIPVRLGLDDWEKMHASRLARNLPHGACSIDASAFTHAHTLFTKKGFGLGYEDEKSGELTHHIWLQDDGDEWGPFRTIWIAFRTWDQFRELMLLLKSLGDQVNLIRIHEPQGIQMQDLIHKPFHQIQTTRKGEFEAGNRAIAYWQMRICDLAGCLAKTSLRGGNVRFNLHLHDPIEAHLESGSTWRGVGGEYVVTLAESSGAEKGTDGTLPTLKASVNAFTRMWLGCRCASGLAVTDDLQGPARLLEELDWILRLPEPHPDWSF